MALLPAHGKPTMATASESKHLKLEVSNFGPIAEGAVELRPMTVFVGPSNTGKSYLATLIYALHRFFGSYLSGRIRRGPVPGQAYWAILPAFGPLTDLDLSAADVEAVYMHWPATEVVG